MGVFAGAGNPAGSGGTAGVGTGVSYIGDHAYAMSGTFTLGDGGSVTCIDFTTPSTAYIDANIQAGFVTRSNDDTRFEVKVNGEVVASSIYNNTYSDNPVNTSGFRLIFGPSARVQILAVKSSGTADDTVVMWMRGRVYS